MKDKIHLTKEQNRRYARQNFTNLVHTNARFEGINTTLSQTQTIMDGIGVDGVPIDDINTIVDLKRGWDYITRVDDPVSLDVAKMINKIVADKDSLDPGELRTGQGGVNIGKETFIPPEMDEDTLKKSFDDILNSDSSNTDKALTLMFSGMRNQMFWDGNKRTATILANKYMIDNGAGLINIPLDNWNEFNDKLSEYYNFGDMSEIKFWTYDVAVQVPNIETEQER